MSKVILQGYILVPDSDLEMVKRELIIHSELTKQESGCRIFEVTQDETNANRFNVYEEFVDKTSFDKHQLRARASKWSEVTKNVSRHYQFRED